ncbi:MAG: SDR family NAD(P)-dependent oxidoreductase [Solirubrobacteraceae bacterium]
MRQGLAGRVAVVTGGASGIGRALGEELAGRGCAVVLADRQVELARAAVDAIAARSGRAEAAELDVRDRDAFEALARDVRGRHGRIDLLFNNAGIGIGGGMETYAAEDWDDVFDVNLRGVAHGVQAVYRGMVEQRTGHIVNTASIAGLLPFPWAGSYAASKHAVVGLTRTLRIEAKRFGVRASVLCPGVVRTPILTGGRFGRTKMTFGEEQMLRVWEQMRPIEPEAFARRAVDGVLRNRSVIVVPAWFKVFWYLDRLSPPVSMRLSELMHERVRRDLGG